jgi:hypothetical protein
MNPGMSWRRHAASFVLLGAALLAGCGGDSSTDSGLIETSPDSGSQDAAPGTNVTARFAEALRVDTVNSSTVQVDQDGTPVGGTVSYDSGDHEIRFTPAAPLDMLTSYRASLSEAILSSDGQPIEPATWNFRTRDGEWQAEDLLPTVVDEPESREFGAHVYAPDGSLWAIWAERDGAARVWASRRTSAGWDEPAEIATVYIENFDLISSVDLMPTMAMNSEGAAVAVWVYPKREDFDSPRVDELWSARWDGTAWSAPERIGVTTGRAYGAKVALDDSGNALVAWRQDSDEWPENVPLLAQRYVAGAGWQSPQELAGTEASAYHWQLDAQRDGSALIAWTDRDAGMISAARFSPSTGWTDASALGTTAVASNLVARQRPDGSALLVWTQPEATGVTSQWSSILQANGIWLSATRLDGDMEMHDLAVSPSGEARLAYSKASGGVQVLTRRLPPDASEWLAAQQVAAFSESTQYVQHPVRLVLDHKGRGVMAIEQIRNDNSRRLWTSRLADPAGDDWSTAEQLSDESESLEDLVGGPSGRAVLVKQVDADDFADVRFE